MTITSYVRENFNPYCTSLVEYSCFLDLGGTIVGPKFCVESTKVLSHGLHGFYTLRPTHKYLETMILFSVFCSLWWKNDEIIALGKLSSFLTADEPF